jgi:hypothetical protein
MSGRIFHLGRLCRSLRDTDFHEWGFVIYRGVYGDDEAWNSFIQCFRDNVHLDLARPKRDAEAVERGAILEQYAQWTVIEDSETLDGASRDDIRQRFLAWREGRIVTPKRPDGPVRWSPPAHWFPSLDDRKPTALPRFTYCLYVDYDCLATLGPHLAGKPSDISQPHLPPPPLVAILIDGEYVPRQDTQGGVPPSDISQPQLPIPPFVAFLTALIGEPVPRQDTQEVFPPIDGSTAKYVGWQYYDTRYICGLYDTLHTSFLNSYNYVRPPLIAPVGTRGTSMPLV